MSIRINKLIIVLLLAGCVLSMPAMARSIVCVDADSVAVSPDGSSWANAYVYIEEAISATAGGNADIWVAEGTYIPDKTKYTSGAPGDNNFKLYEDVNLYGGFAGDEIVFEDRDPANNPTILSGDGSPYRIIYAYNLYTIPPVIDGFTITDARYGIYCQNSDITVSNCEVSDHSEDGVYCISASNPVITDSTIRNNTQAGIYCSNGSPEISRCKIQFNGEDGIYINDSFTSGYDPVVTNCWIHDNDLSGIYFNQPGSDDVIRNNTIVNNNLSGSPTNGGIYSDDPDVRYFPNVSNTIVWGNLQNEIVNCEVGYSCVMGDAPGIGNHPCDPLFAYDPIGDPNNYDFHITAGSLCIDAGAADPNTYIEGELDIDGDDRVYNERIDIGADEFVPTVEPYKTRDFNGDGKIDELDLALLAAVWLSAEGDDDYDAKYDLDGSGGIDNVDFARFAAEWLTYVKSANFDDAGAVNYLDLAIFEQTWLLQAGDGGFNEACDLNASGNVDIDDLLSLAERWLN